MGLRTRRQPGGISQRERAIIAASEGLELAHNVMRRWAHRPQSRQYQDAVAELVEWKKTLVRLGVDPDRWLGGNR
jgi:hypothetical protein